MESNRAASEIASQYTCETEIRTAGEARSNPGAPADTPEDSRSGYGYRCVARAALSSLLFRLAAPSSSRSYLCRHLELADVSPGYRYRPDEVCGQCTPSGCAPRPPLTSGEKCQQCSRPHRPVDRAENRTFPPRTS